MKKIGVFLGPKPIGGEFQYHLTMIEAAAALPADRFSIVFGYTSDIWLTYLAAYDLRTVFVPSSGFLGKALWRLWTKTGMPVGMWRAISSKVLPMARTLLQEKCDLWIFPSATFRSFQIPVPALVSIHDLMHRYEQRFPEAASNKEYSRREHYFSNICRWAKGVIVDSIIGRLHVNECYKMMPEKIHVLPYIAPSYMYTAGTPPDFDNRYRLPEKFLFYPAQLWEHKNHRNLIKAVIQLKKEIPDLKLVLSGSQQNAYDSILQLVRNHNLDDDIIFLGYVHNTDMPELYRRARALVMPTFYGPTNIPPLEAFVAGCPVAISNIYAIPEQVDDAALLFNPESVSEIADCIVRLWTDDKLCSDLVVKGRKRAYVLSQKQFNEQLLQIIERSLRHYCSSS